MVRMLSGTAHRGSDLERGHNTKVVVEGVCEVDGPASFGFLPFSLFPFPFSFCPRNVR
jgi:hypothetical protein